MNEHIVLVSKKKRKIALFGGDQGKMLQECEKM